MELKLEVHLKHQVQGRSDLRSLIEELITFAKTQPQGAVVSFIYEGTPLYIHATDSFSGVYSHYIFARTRHLRVARFVRR